MPKKLVSQRQVKALEQIISQLQSEDTEKQFLRCIKAIDLFASILQNNYSVSELIRMCLKLYELPDAYLARILGSRSRSSEILSGKRTPSLADIKALKAHLGIPADLLISEPEEAGETLDFSGYPINEIVKRGWVPAELKKKPEAAIQYLCSEVNVSISDTQMACLRQLPRKNSKTDSLALQAWLLGVRLEAQKLKLVRNYNPKKVDASLLTDIVQELGRTSQGIKKVQRYLADLGIRFVMVPHFKGTHLDGAVLFGEDKNPIVALTGRYDRVDNFWFVLLHELAHLVLGHVKVGSNAIFDDMDIAPTEGHEAEADKLATDAAISPSDWKMFRAHRASHSSILDFSLDLDISPAIVAGRVRYETKNYRIFTSLIGQGEVKKQFPEVFG
ncbi:MAG: ImmA/IrrE family metallo-endopeptidase [Deltaproteobacteria bacterium]|nr:ImmA/IrrE family metallo-endopeptidase [Deltaproteobacteria bacterium]